MRVNKEEERLFISSNKKKLLVGTLIRQVFSIVVKLSPVILEELSLLTDGNNIKGQ